MSGWQGFAALALYAAGLWLLLRIDTCRRRRRELERERGWRRARLLLEEDR